MKTKTKIEWTEKTWNPTTGCTKISEGCQECYAAILSKRLKCMGQKKYVNEFKFTIHPECLKEPYLLKKPSIIFVNSMSDLFHKNMSISFIQGVFQVMNDNPQHIFQVLTKRADILEKYSPLLNWTDNIWMGVTIESDKYLHRVDSLIKTGAKIKFLSCEPLLTSLKDLNLLGIDWVIVGGESGNKARPIDKVWVNEIKDNCKMNNVPFFFKQWGGKNKKKAGSLLDGVYYKEMPTSLLERGKLIIK